ncbi:MAG: histone deacetylase [Planctomycetaceae bacterium]|nr:histone deacetylase [Planctomycetaceae bacterium]
MSIFYTDVFVLPLPETHKFPMSKYALLRERVSTHEAISATDLKIPPAATDEQILRAHSRDYLERVKSGELSYKELRRIGFPWSPQMVERSRRSTGATIAAIGSALFCGLGINLAGGTHHAFRDQGEGYCVFNDSVVAARHWQAEGHVNRVLIVDADVHQGNGTASITADDDSIFTFSIHGEKNFPYYKEKSDLDIALPDEIGDEAYLESLDDGLERAFEKSRPDLVMYLAGADPYELDRFGRLKLTKDGLAERDRIVIERCRSEGLPLTISMAGGYAPDVHDTVEIHFATVCQAWELFGLAHRTLYNP